VDVLSYFRAEIETVGRHWRDLLAGLDESSAKVRPLPSMNHAVWLTGHMTWAEDYFIVQVPSGTALRDTSRDVLFDHSSEKLADDRYPSFQEIRGEYTRVHTEVKKHLSRLSAADLVRPSALERRWLPTNAHAIAHQVTHGHYHLGQLVYLEKWLRQGKP